MADSRTPLARLDLAVAVLLCLSTIPTCMTFRFPSDEPPEEDATDMENVVPVEVSKAAPAADGGWSGWGAWMTCSRSCDGGVSVGLRKCRGKCPEGESVRRQICNMQPCPERNNFRATQCSAYDDVPYRERRYRWLPFHDPDDPCALVCQAEGFNFVAKLSSKVLDGTRCREGALDMCVQGRCQPIGCDLRVGSSLKVDECGICGGDGSRCLRPTFHWHDGPFALCSVTCGGGVQLSEISCRNKETQEPVDPRLCNLSIRPRAKARQCNRHPCPVVWESGEWGPCSASCGPGVQRRSVWCVQGGPNGSRLDIQAEFCPRHKPLAEKSCTLRECPKWYQGPWSACSATCGGGLQTRAVVCRDTNNQYSDHCDLREMPRPQKSCSAPEPCPLPEEETEPPTLPPCLPAGFGEDDSTPTTTVTSTTATSTMPTTTTEPTTPLITTLLPLNWTFSARSFFQVGAWEPCNAQGYRRRPVHCQILLEFSRTVVRLPDSECPDVRPVDVEPCGAPCLPPSSPQTTRELEEIAATEDDSFHSWNTEEFSPCSATCGGGTQRSVVRCLRLPDEVQVSEVRCEVSERPEVFIRSCSDQPCPISHSWNVSEFGECSRTCGGGVRTRQVRCLSLLDGREAAASHCPAPHPKETDACNVFDCPPAWKTEPWSKCSRSCSGGFQTRKLHCEKVLAPLAQTVQLPPSKCLRTRPKAVKKCNPKACPAPAPEPPQPTRSTTAQPPPTETSQANAHHHHTAPSEVTTAAQIVTTITTSEDADYFEQKHPNRRVTLKARGRALLYKGSTAKFHCPVHPATNASRVLWFKGHRRIPPDTGGGWPRVSASGKGALRIRKMVFSDAGTYTCLAGAFRSDVALGVKPLPLVTPLRPEGRAGAAISRRRSPEKRAMPEVR